MLEQFLPAWLPFSDIEGLIRWGGLLALIIIVFAETGLLVGFFLPGDSLLFTAGLLAAAGLFDIKILIIALILAAIIGDQVGYATGKHLGRKLFQKKDSKFFKRDHLMKAEAFYEKYGAKTIVLARFVPIVRTFAPIVAGVSNMEYRKFVTYNIFGGILWVVLMCGSGYWLVKLFPAVEEYLHYIIVGIIILSVLPILYEWLQHKRSSA